MVLLFEGGSMSRILIIYGTTHGQTAKIARFLGDEIRARGAEPDVVLAGEGAPGPAGYAGVIVAASLHAGGFQRSVARWVRQHRARLREPHTAFLAVCLGILQRDDP